jgi:hypothetical protein
MPERLKKLNKMNQEASSQEQRMVELIEQLTDSDELDSEKLKVLRTIAYRQKQYNGEKMRVTSRII